MYPYGLLVYKQAVFLHQKRKQKAERETDDKFDAPNKYEHIEHPLNCIQSGDDHEYLWLIYIGVGSSSVKSSVKCTKSTTNTITPKSYEYE